jgi:predicted RNA-binding protein with EMAP domain
MTASGIEIAYTFVGTHDEKGDGYKLAAAQNADGLVVGNDFVWCVAFLDYDYEYAWLLMVRDNDDSDKVSYLLVHQRPDVEKLDVEWFNYVKKNFDDGYIEREEDALYWFVGRIMDHQRQERIGTDFE